MRILVNNDSTRRTWLSRFLESFRNWTELGTVKSELPVGGDRMLARWADKSYARVFTHDTIGLRGISCKFFDKVLGCCLCRGLILL